MPRRVSTFPRSSVTSRSERIASSCERRRRLDVPTVAPFGKVVERLRADQRVARVLGRRHRGDHESRRQVARDVLGAVHRDVDLTGEQRVLDLLDEAGLVADRAGAISRGLDRHHLARERLGHRPSLRERERAPAGPYPQRRQQAQRARLRVRLIGVTIASSSGSCAAGSPAVLSNADRDSASSPNSSRSACT